MARFYAWRHSTVWNWLYYVKLNKNISKSKIVSPSPTGLSNGSYIHMPPHIASRNLTYRSSSSSQQMMNCCHHHHHRWTTGRAIKHTNQEMRRQLTCQIRSQYHYWSSKSNSSKALHTHRFHHIWPAEAHTVANQLVLVSQGVTGYHRVVCVDWETSPISYKPATGVASEHFRVSAFNWKTQFYIYA